MSSQDHLHQETMVMPIRQHSELLTKQFLAKSFLPNNPGHQHLQPRPPAPELPATLEKDEGESPLYPPSNPRGVQKGPKIPPHCRREEINRGCSPKQRTPISPPTINPAQQSLSQRATTGLAQLSSGFSRKLKSYLHRLDETVTDQCPKCSASPHDTAHLFNCRNDQTDPTVESLWTKPCKAAAFLHFDGDDEEA